MTAGATQADPLDRARTVRGVVFDVDGVLTDGRIIYSDDGHEIKAFNVQDGASIKLLMSQGIDVAIITGRRSPMVARRARELGVTHCLQGAESKRAALAQLIEAGFAGGDAALACIGDDIQDLELFDAPEIILSMTVPNAHPEVLARAHYVTDRCGGEGVAIEVAALILKAQDKWPF